MNIDQALDNLGGFKAWQIWSFFWILVISVFNGAIEMTIVFLQHAPEHVCYNELLSTESNWTFEEVRQFSTPKNHADHYLSCQMYERNYTEITNVSYAEATEKLLINGTFVPMNHTRMSCGSGSYYNTVQMEHTAVTDWDLGCEPEKIAYAQTAYEIGAIFGLLISGYLSDKFGRKTVALSFGFVAGIFGVINCLVRSYVVFVATRVFMGLCNVAVLGVIYVLGAELCNTKNAEAFSTLFWGAWSIGFGILSAIAYGFKDWRLMQLVVCIPYCLLPFVYPFLPESPRWLMSQNKVEAANAIVNKAARWNRIELEGDKGIKLTSLDSKLPSDEVEESEADNISIAHVCRHPRLVIRSLILIICWIVNSLVYFGISLLVTQFAGNIFINNAISAAVEMPSNMLTGPFLLFGHRRSMALVMVIAGASLLLYLPIPAGLAWAQLLVAMVGKSSINMSTNTIYVVTVQLYPTSIRGAVTTFFVVTSRIGNILAPYINIIPSLNESLKHLPMIIYGATPIIAAVMAMLLPETKGLPIPQTIDEALKR